jgi:hypothetical protein
MLGLEIIIIKNLGLIFILKKDNKTYKNNNPIKMIIIILLYLLPELLIKLEIGICLN